MKNKKFTVAACIGAALFSMGIVKVVSELKIMKQEEAERESMIEANRDIHGSLDDDLPNFDEEL